MILSCNNCSLTISLTPTNPTSKHLINNYGKIDTVTGRIIEITCPYCDGELVNIENIIIENIIDQSLKTNPQSD